MNEPVTLCKANGITTGQQEFAVLPTGRLVAPAHSDTRWAFYDFGHSHAVYDRIVPTIGMLKTINPCAHDSHYWTGARLYRSLSLGAHDI